MKAFTTLMVLAVSLAGTARAVTYTIADLGSGYVVNPRQAKVINDAGEIIANDLAATGHGFLYTGGSWHDLGALNTSGIGIATSTVRGLNNMGVVVGLADTGNSEQTDAFVRSGFAGAFTALGLVGAGDASKDAAAFAINDRGAIVGSLVDNTERTASPFVFQQGGGLLSSGVGSDHNFAINNFGDILGRSTGETPRTVINGVPLPAATDGFTPQTLNHAGQILLTLDGSLPIKGVWGLLYNYGTGKLTKLPNLAKDSIGDAAFLALNDFGHVVGRGTDANGMPHAIFYSPETGITSLDALDFTIGAVPVHLVEACGINNAGQIVCTGYLDGDADTVTRVFLLDPDAPPVLPLAATYDGIAKIGGNDTGACSITVMKTDTFSAKLVAPGISYAFSAKLTGGVFNGQVTVKGVTLTVNLQADAAHRKITGTIADGTTTFDVIALRQAKLGIFAGKLTALFQVPAAPTPQGIGFGQITVSKAGAIKIVGVLGDGSPYTVSATLHYDGTWTFYTPLYLKDTQPGGIAGTITFNRIAADSDCAGTLRWVKPGAFTTDVSLKAAYFKAVKGTQLLRFTNTTAGVATFAFAGGEQSLASHTLSVSNKNVVTVTDPGADALAVKLATGNGALSGSFIHPATNKPAPFTGVVQQKLNIAGGLFLGPTTAGSVLLTPQ